MSNYNDPIVQKSINTIRFLAIDGVQKAGSGHPGMPMGVAPLAYHLYKNVMNHNPANPKWLNRDRFVLSGGHGSMLLYSILHLSGYELPLDELKQFRQWGSLTPGHPEVYHTPGVETTTGPLGQGLANAVGMAMAYEFLSNTFNKDDIKILDHYVYAEMGDGDVMEGVSHEVSSFAAHNKLGNLIVIYDDNNVTIDGKVGLAMSENVMKRYEAYGWHVQRVEDGNNLEELDAAIKNAQVVTDKPSLIAMKTIIGYGSPNKANTSAVHGAPLGADEVEATKKNLGCEDLTPFYVSDDVYAHFADIKSKGEEVEKVWNETFEKYKEKYPKEAKLFTDVMAGNFGDEWIKKLPVVTEWGKKIATRQASGAVINAIAGTLPTLFGGSADLAPSNNTMMKDIPAFSADNKAGRNLHFGIREHGMGSIMNGIALYGGTRTYGGTFIIFSNYMRPPIRMAAIMGINPIYIFTHDSIGLGEDGPTHQPVEQLSDLRAIPGVNVLRPADANETSYAWKIALQSKKNPTVIALTRQGLPTINREVYASAENVEKGGYVLNTDVENPDLIIMASGSEVELALGAAEELKKQNVAARVVNMFSFELFDSQTEEYKESVLPKSVTARVSIEAGISFGWHKYLGLDGRAIALETFGASAPAEVLFEKYGFTTENVVKTALEVLKK